MRGNKGGVTKQYYWQLNKWYELGFGRRDCDLLLRHHGAEAWHGSVEAKRDAVEGCASRRSDCGADRVLENAGTVEEAAMLHKPYRRRELADAVRRALYAGPSSRVVG